MRKNDLNVIQKQLRSQISEMKGEGWKQSQITEKEAA